MTAQSIAWALIIAIAVVSLALSNKRRDLVEYYSRRRILYRDWLKLYGEKEKPRIKEFLRCFGSSFFVPKNLIHKLGPLDGVMDFYHRDYSSGEADALEANIFVDELKKRFGYIAEESDGKLTMSELFEKATGAKKRTWTR